MTRARDLPLLLAASFAVFSDYAPLVSVVPLWSATGGSSGVGAGAATGVTMGAGILVQLCMGRLVRVLGLRRLLITGSLLLSLPTAAYLLSPALGWVLAVSAVRGAGFGMAAVAGSALAAELAPPGRRASVVGWYGAAAGLPQVICLPLGVWCAQTFGFPAVFLGATVLGGLAVPLAWALVVPSAAPGGGPAVEPAAVEASVAEAPVVEASVVEASVLPPTAPPHPPAGGFAPLVGLLALLAASAAAVGGVTSFLAFALPAPGAAAVVLFALSAAMILGRLAAGGLADRIGEGRTLVPAVIAAALGTGGIAAAVLLTAAATVPAALAAVLCGAGFGALQNETLVLVFARTGPARRGMASTAWNMAYDVGTGAGSLLVGVASRLVGVGGAFLLSAAVVAAVLPGAWARPKPGESQPGQEQPGQEQPGQQQPGQQQPGEQQPGASGPPKPGQTGAGTGTRRRT
ncbi:MFS transporter [Kitasatospora sp. NPDC098652]|uniref:MFS transporter n=1 Tax=Kitasatospora sp. NPDC098652 TaxID=3364095 RepID=UPI00380C70D2